MAEYLIREESLVEIADAVRTHFKYYDGVMGMLTDRNNLESIVIPDTVTFIGLQSFQGCYHLTNIYLHSTTPPTLASTNGFAIATTTIHVPVGTGDAYKTATNWSSFADKIVEDIVI